MPKIHNQKIYLYIYIYICVCVCARVCVCIYIVIHVKPNCNRMKTEQVLRNESDPFTSKPRFPSLTLGIWILAWDIALWRTGNLCYCPYSFVLCVYLQKWFFYLILLFNVFFYYLWLLRHFSYYLWIFL